MQLMNVVVLLSCVAIAVCANQTTYVEHVNRNKLLPCGAPQPRVFELKEVIAEDIVMEKTNGHEEWIRPAVTVLHRCNSTGCCKNPKQRCIPVEAADIMLTFAITEGSVQYFDVPAINHTECACA